MEMQQTLNTAGEPSTTAQEAPAAAFHITEDGLKSTVERAIPAVDKVADPSTPSSEDAKPTDGQPGKTDDGAEAKAPEKEPPFHEHPRWQELQAEKKQLIEQLAELRGRVSSLPTSGQLPQGQAGPSTPADYRDLSALPEEEIVNWQVERPRDFYSNLAKQIYREVSGAIMRQVEEKYSRTTEEERTRKTYEDYTAKNSDFDGLWKSGDIRKFMDANPGHNPISAHQMLTAEHRSQDIEKRIAEAATKAAKEAEEKFKVNLQAKQNAKVLSSAPASGAGSHRGIPDELKNPKKYGGVTSVLSQRLAARRAGTMT